MKISIIAAMGELRTIGKNNELPWHLPADLKYFKEVTMGKPIIMGRKTYESIGKALPGRQNIIVTKNKDYQLDAPVSENTSVNIVHSLDEALKAVPEATKEVMIIGGATLFNEAMNFANTLYITHIHAKFNGDTHFPVVNENQWLEYWRQDYKADDKNPYDYSFVRYMR